MSKKFDVVIGNPPYQEEAVGDATSSPPIYPAFMDAAHELARRAVLITPARFLFNAGYTSKIWNQKMLNDEHLSAPIYVPNSDKLFPGTDIKGGVVITYRNSEAQLGPIGVFTKDPMLAEILSTVRTHQDPSLSQEITKRDAYKYTDTMHDETPQASALMSRSSQFIINSNAFEKLPFLFHTTKPDDGKEYASIFGVLRNKRLTRWIRTDFITGPASFASYKVAIPKANGSGEFGEALATPAILEPNSAVTQTFLTIGAHTTREQSEACVKYIKSKFARAMLGALKITQDNPARVWKHVPLQDFTDASDIDWSKSIPEIDQQLYAKYGLSDEEIAFIESHVKPMD